VLAHKKKNGHVIVAVRCVGSSDAQTWRRERRQADLASEVLRPGCPLPREDLWPRDARSRTLRPLHPFPGVAPDSTL